MYDLFDMFFPAPDVLLMLRVSSTETRSADRAQKTIHMLALATLQLSLTMELNCLFAKPTCLTSRS